MASLLFYNESHKTVKIMIKKKKTSDNSDGKSTNSWWKWYLRGALVWVGLILLLCYLIYFHAGVCIPPESKGYFLEVIFKNVLIIIVFGLFLYFFVLQNYHYTVGLIMELFAEESPEGPETPEPDAYSKKNDMGLLIHSVDAMFQTNLTYRSILEKQDTLLFENFLARLMKGQVRSESMVRQSCEKFGLDINAREFVILLFSLKFSDEQVPDETVIRAYAYLKEIVGRFIREDFKGYMTEVDGMVSCLLMSDTEETLESVNSTVEISRISKLTQQILDKKFGCIIQTCVSNANRGILGCENAFSEAMELLQYSKIVGAEEDTIFYADIKQAKLYGDNDYLWFKYERKFINCINAEDYKGAAETFDKLMDNDYIAHAASLKLASCRLFGLLNAMINALGEVRLSTDADFFEELDPQGTLLNCQTFPELRERSKEIFQKIDSYSQVQNKSVSYSKIMGVVDYLKDHFANPDLSIVSVADYFNINPSYLSRTFKKIMGIGLSDYLQKLRIREAIRLLRESELTVSEIAAKVGYNNALTMNRAFKKFEGVTPSQQRQKEREP